MLLRLRDDGAVTFDIRTGLWSARHLVVCSSPTPPDENRRESSAQTHPPAGKPWQLS
jgi:hypothetical protein